MKKVGLPIKKADHKFTYVDYSSWPDDERWELIDGVAYNMSPAPTSTHQRLCGELFFRLKTLLMSSSCEPFIAPFDVYFPEYPGQDFNSIDTTQIPKKL